MSGKRLLKALFETPLYEPRPTTIILPKLESQAARSGHLEQSLWIFETLLGFDVWLHDFQLPESDLGIGPWRLQLMPTPLLTLPAFSDREDTFGLRYKLHYHSQMLGAVELFSEEFARDVSPKAPEDHYLVSVFVLIKNQIERF